MNFVCPCCGVTHFITNKSLLLLKGFFHLVQTDFSFICDNCGKDMESKYTDPYGIGV